MRLKDTPSTSSSSFDWMLTWTSWSPAGEQLGRSRQVADRAV